MGSASKHKERFQPLFFLLAGLACGLARAEDSQLVSKLDQFFADKKVSASDIGLSVYSLSHSKQLVERNADKLYSPASAVKVLTALVALRRLGPDFRFHTQASAQKEWDERGRLKGDLYLVGGGDPSLKHENLYLLARQLRRQGLKRIQGSLVVDDWIFDQEHSDPARIPSESDHPFNAPIDGLSLDGNTFEIYVRPAAKAGTKALVSFEPECVFLKIKNASKTVEAKETGKNPGLSIARESATDEQNVFSVSGNVLVGSPDVMRRFNITNPWGYTGSVFLRILKEVGIQVVGKKLKHEKAPEMARVVADVKSIPLSEILFEMNKTSSNFIADSLVKSLGSEVYGAPGTMEKGVKVVTEEANRLGINSAGFKFVSGSGLTRLNRISPRHFTDLFRAAFQDFDVLPEWLASLSIAGMDGTLEKKMHGNPAFGRFRGKTGTIDGVSAMTGMVQTKAGELLTYAVLINGTPESRPGSTRWQDGFGRILAEYGSAGAAASPGSR